MAMSLAAGTLAGSFGRSTGTTLEGSLGGGRRAVCGRSRFRDAVPGLTKGPSSPAGSFGNEKGGTSGCSLGSLCSRVGFSGFSGFSGLSSSSPTTNAVPPVRLEVREVVRLGGLSFGAGRGCSSRLGGCFEEDRAGSGRSSSNFAGKAEGFSSARGTGAGFGFSAGGAGGSSAGGGAALGTGAVFGVAFSAGTEGADGGEGWAGAGWGGGDGRDTGAGGGVTSSTGGLGAGLGAGFAAGGAAAAGGGAAAAGAPPALPKAFSTAAFCWSLGSWHAWASICRNTFVSSGFRPATIFSGFAGTGALHAIETASIILFR
mmetsp:Transcript_37376/g.60524  ORF Transcript_37376/g.60524 Transcript_37376/m.60524 type:complete len:316 (-) Transcript_37376:272-1219(-)